MMRIRFYLIITVFLLYLGACSDDNPSDSGGQGPVLNNINPTKAAAGTQLTLEGNNFGTDRNGNYVDFRGLQASDNDYVEWNDSSIVVVIPENAVSGKVKVVVDNKSSNGLQLNIIEPGTAPAIEYIYPETIEIGREVYIKGMNFGLSRSNSTIDFNGTPAGVTDIISWSDTLITVLTPYSAKSGGLSVTVNGVRSNVVNFTIYKTIVTMVLIPSGSFNMGSDDFDWSYPVHKATISYEFFMAETEITQKQWKEVFGSISNPSKAENDENPVEQLNWYRAIRFCNELSVIEGLDSCYEIDGDNVTCDFTKKGYRLPTEAEWEYACRAGSDGKFAGVIDDIAWTSNDNTAFPQPVAMKEPNAFGLYDMHGNVAEWCWDGFDATFYENSPETDPRVDPGPDYPEVVRRGGAYLNSPDICASGRRESLSPTLYNFDTGFRIVRTK